MKRVPLAVAGMGLWAATVVVGGAAPGQLTSWGANFSRPAVLPFLWRGVDEATRSGDAAETLAQARLLLAAIPSWVDGYLVFSYQFALDGGDRIQGPARTAQASLERLQLALALLDQGRRNCPKRAVELLGSMAFLVEIMARNVPGLAALMSEQGGRGPSAVADGLLAEAEALEDASGSQSARMQRLFLVPRLCAALLRGDSPTQAVRLLDTAIARCGILVDRELGEEWEHLLTELKRCILDDPAADPAVLLDDPRFEPLYPFLQGD